MGFETGGLVSHVYVSKDELNGSTVEALQETQQRLVRDETAHPKIVDALVEIIERGTDNGGGRMNPVNRFKGYGYYLFGWHTDAYNAALRPFDGLLYAHGRPLLEDIDAFRGVEVGTWVYSGFLGGEEAVVADLKSAALSSRMVRGAVWGVPVSRMTRIMDLDGVEEPSRFGQGQDLDAIAALEVPEVLKDSLVVTAKTFHADEIDAYQTQLDPS